MNVPWSIRFLGTAASAFSRSRNPTSMLLTVGEQDCGRVLIDCPEGVTRRLVDLDIDLNTIDVVFISHGHADHLGGIVSFLWQNWLVCQRTKPLEIVAPDYIHGRIKTLLELGSTPHGAIPFQIIHTDTSREVEHSAIPMAILNECQITKKIVITRQHAVTTHDPEAHALRVDITNEDGDPVVSFCYSSDTSPDDNVAKLATSCTYLIHEATLLDEDVEKATLYNHSTPSGAGKVATSAGVQTLVLVHYSTMLDGKEQLIASQAKNTFSGNVIVAKDLMLLE